MLGKLLFLNMLACRPSPPSLGGPSPSVLLSAPFLETVRSPSLHKQMLSSETNRLLSPTPRLSCSESVLAFVLELSSRLPSLPKNMELQMVDCNLAMAAVGGGGGVTDWREVWRLLFAIVVVGLRCRSKWRAAFPRRTIGDGVSFESSLFWWSKFWWLPPPHPAVSLQWTRSLLSPFLCTCLRESPKYRCVWLPDGWVGFSSVSLLLVEHGWNNALSPWSLSTMDAWADALAYWGEQNRMVVIKTSDHTSIIQIVVFHIYHVLDNHCR